MNSVTRFWHIWRAIRQEPPEIERLQRRRAADLVAFARHFSPFYYRHYRHLPASGDYAWHDLPPVTKSTLMDHYDQWATDPAVTRAGVDAFVGDKTLVGQSFLDRYAVFVTSGTTGTPGIFLHDAKALSVYDQLWFLRGWLPWQGWARIMDVLRPGFAEVFVVASGDHYAGATQFERLRRRYPWMARRLHSVSILLPHTEVVSKLNLLQPTVLATYPTALPLLSREQQDGRLHIHPQFILSSGEWLMPAVRQEAAAAFGCAVREMYSSSEFFYMAFACDQRRLHVNADWLLLEPVDGDYRPVPPGELSHTTLITNLANRVQPIIRYDLGDRTALDAEPCPCGNRMPTVRVEGRRDEVLAFRQDGGALVQVLPMALATVVETTPGVRRYQLIQVGPKTLRVRLEVRPDAEAPSVWRNVTANLHSFLASQGASGVTINQAEERPHRDPRTGKFRQVWQEMKSVAGSGPQAPAA
ncbi:MAG: phenylacetate--CoA ligase family protein [Anaerolineae bacterium]|nr:phenylacetate--CoA ligase family protein [Anaerolineae bacterium]